MAIPTLKRVCQLRLVEDLIKDGHGCLSLENSCSYILSQLDQGAWGIESLAILDRAAKFYNSVLTPRVILALLPRNTKSLVLKECPLLTADCVNIAMERCSFLEYLDLTENTHLNFSHVDLLSTVLFTRKESLTGVIFEDCTQINDIHVQTLLLNAPNLQHLNIARCNVTDNVFLLNEQKQLAREACFQIDGLAMDFDSKLHTVDVSRCDNFSSTGVRYLCSLCGPSLQEVNLSWTKVDCTAFLYLSGMGLPHVVQFFLSSSVVNSSLLETLVYTLHQFDAICEDILLKWTKGDETQQTIGEPERTNESAVDVAEETEVCETRHLPSHVVHLNDINPELRDSANNEKVNCLDRSFSLSPCDFLYSSSPDSITIEDISGSKKDDITQHQQASTVASEDITSSTCERLFAAENDENRSLSPSSPNSFGATSSQQSHYNGIQSTSMSSSASVDKEKNRSCCGVTDNEDCDNFDDKQNSLIKAECHHKYLKQDDFENNLNENTNVKCDVVKKHCDDTDVKSCQCRDSVTAEDFDGLETVSDGNFNLDEDKNLCSCEEKNLSFSDELKCSSKSPPGDKKMSSIINSDQNTVSCTPPKKEREISHSKNTLKMKMDFDPNICSLQINGIVFKEENVGLLCLQTFLKSNKNLQSVTLCGGMTGNFVTDMMIDLIGHYSHNLAYLSIEGCDQVTNIGASAILNNCQQISTLDLTGVPFLGDSGIIPLLRCLPLKSLLLAETQISGLSLDVMSKMASVAELKDLDLSWCEEIAGDSFLNKLLELCSSLKRLMLRETSLTASTLSIIAGNCHNIIELSIASNMSNVLDDSVVLLTENLPLLETIDLSWNSHLTDKSIHSLLKNCHHLGTANLEGLKRITSSALVPIIVVPDELKDFLTLTISKTNESQGQNSGDLAVKTEILPCLPHRSTTYCTELRYVNLKYSDFVEDTRLQELVTMTQGAIKVIDYYGEEVEQSTVAMENLLKRYLESTRVT